MSSTPSSATPGTYLLRIVLVSMVLLVVAFIVLTAAVRTHAQATVLVRLLLERPVCGPCISEKAGMAVADIEPLPTRISQTIFVKSGTDRCRACGTSTLVYSLFRKS